MRKIIMKLKKMENATFSSLIYLFFYRFNERSKIKIEGDVAEVELFFEGNPSMDMFDLELFEDADILNFEYIRNVEDEQTVEIPKEEKKTDFMKNQKKQQAEEDEVFFKSIPLNENVRKAINFILYSENTPRDIKAQIMLESIIGGYNSDPGDMDEFDFSKLDENIRDVYKLVLNAVETEITDDLNEAFKLANIPDIEKTQVRMKLSQALNDYAGKCIKRWPKVKTTDFLKELKDLVSK